MSVAKVALAAATSWLVKFVLDQHKLQVMEIWSSIQYGVLAVGVTDVVFVLIFVLPLLALIKHVVASARVQWRRLRLSSGHWRITEDNYFDDRRRQGEVWWIDFSKKEFCEAKRGGGSSSCLSPREEGADVGGTSARPGPILISMAALGMVQGGAGVCERWQFKDCEGVENVFEYHAHTDRVMWWPCTQHNSDVTKFFMFDRSDS
jgi:hypothetical protein